MTLIDEATATEIAIMCDQFLRRACIHRRLLDVVNGTYVVKTTTGYEVPLGLFEGTGHDP
jgi:hypothetical protein